MDPITVAEPQRSYGQLQKAAAAEAAERKEERDKKKMDAKQGLLFFVQYRGKGGGGETLPFLRIWQPTIWQHASPIVSEDISKSKSKLRDFGSDQSCVLCITARLHIEHKVR